MIYSLPSILSQHKANIQARIKQYDYDTFNKVTFASSASLENNQPTSIPSKEGKWSVQLETQQANNQPLAFDVKVTFELTEGKSSETNLSLDICFDNWSVDNFVLLPAAAYNGNRFESRRIAYSPKLLDPKDIGVDKPITVSDIPRLNIKAGPSFIQERSGSMTTPSAGFFAPAQKFGFWMQTTQANQLGDYGYNIEENRNRNKATFSISSPLVRELYKYRIVDNQFPSDDQAKNFVAGDKVVIEARLYFFGCADIQQLFDTWTEIRNDLVSKTEVPVVFPYSSVFKVQEKKFNDMNWVEQQGYYSVGMREMFLQDWQMGWTGGMITTLPLLVDGSAETKERVIRQFNWLFPEGIAPSGFFYDSGESDGDEMYWYGGDIRKPHTANWHLIRKSADGLYYILKQFKIMEQMQISIDPSWHEGTQTVANAFVTLWDKYHQFGNYVNSISGDVEVGGSTSAGLAPAALVYAAQYFNQPQYLQTACESAEYFYQNYVAKGITCGGVGDAMQNPDSESAYGVLESFAVLYEATKDTKWLKYAQEMSNQFETWVMNYNYEFPKDCTLGKMNIKTAGTVFANTQNKHGGPGICTHSGIALLRLYRATGEVKYLSLLQDIARHIPQMLSHPERPIPGSKIGFMTERVSTTDWYEGIGEIMTGTTWAETSLMLTYTEIPSVYIDVAKKTAFSFDFIQTEIVEITDNQVKIKITNPSKYEGNFKILVDANKQNPLPFNPLMNCTHANIKANSSETIIIHL